MVTMLMLLGSTALPVRAQNQDDPPPQHQDDPPKPDEDPQQDDSGIGQLEEEPPETEEDRKIKPRLRPSTDEEERAFKRQATRNDPFLNPLLPLEYERIDNSGYNPRDSVLPQGFQDLSRFIVQEPAGGVLGFLSIHCSVEDQPLAGQVLNVVRLYEFEPQQRIELQVQLSTMRPILTQLIPLGERRSQQAMDLGLEEALRAEYLFDRVTIRQNVGGITGVERKRMLPFSFDINQLDSLVRSLDYDNADWPLVAVVFDPDSRENIPISIEQPRRTSIKSAELSDYGCWEMVMHVGNENWQWWVERLEPHRIIKWTDGQQRSHTLLSYTTGY